jgi:hypothetical protein
VDAGIYAAAGAVVVAILGGLVTWLTVRRTASGKISTTDAGTLWAASEKMREETIAQLTVVTAQRDRLIESQTALLIPMLTGINESLRQITESLARLGGP